MEQSQVVCCSSPPLCKLEPESPPSWDTVDFTESNFGEFWTDENWKDYDVGIKNFSSGDVLIDLDMLLKEEPFSWIDERNDDDLYTSHFEWTSDSKVFNETTSHNHIEEKPFLSNVDLTIETSVTTTASANNNVVTVDNRNNRVNNNNSNTAASGNDGIDDSKLFHHHHQLVHQQHQHQNNEQLVVPAAATTPDFLTEIEKVLINTSTSTTTALTPPESPRDQTTSLITLLQEIEPCNTPSNNEIDAIVATQAENMVSSSHHHQDNVANNQQPIRDPLSPDPWSSPSMGSSSSSDSGYDDPDWSPSSPTLQSSSSSSSINNTSTSSSSTRRKRAAATTTEERKMRKKEQNKNAATRYRQKKKQEIEVIIGEERELMEKHDHLKADVTEITREIRYLKSLLRDLYKAKGLIS